MTIASFNTTMILLDDSDRKSLDEYLAAKCGSCCLDADSDRAAVVAAVATWLYLHTPAKVLK